MQCPSSKDKVLDENEFVYVCPDGFLRSIRINYQNNKTTFSDVSLSSVAEKKTKSVLMKEIHNINSIECTD